jgi:MFS family permease
MVVLVSGVAVGLFLILFSQMRLPLAGLVAAGILGLGQATFMTVNSILVQSHVDDVHRGRAMSVLMMIFGFGSVGTLCLGALASVIGVSTTFAVAGLGISAAVLLVSGRFPQLRRLS